MSDEYNAGIAGGCGACEKCDPEFWLQKAKERIKELEAENRRLREVLERVAKTSCYCAVRERCLSCDARRALGGEG
jgi:hypothetical protein